MFKCRDLVYIFAKGVNSKINALHYRAVKLVYCDNESSFEELLIRDKSITVHHRNIHYLAIGMLVFLLHL